MNIENIPANTIFVLFGYTRPNRQHCYAFVVIKKKSVYMYNGREE